MLCVDVNVLVYAHREDIPDHSDYRRLLERLANGDEPLGLPDLALGGFVRVMTNRRIFAEPTSSDDAWEAVGALLAPGLPAPYALENNATWLGADRGFARFHRLRWSHPLDLQM